MGGKTPNEMKGDFFLEKRWGKLQKEAAMGSTGSKTEVKKNKNNNHLPLGTQDNNEKICGERPGIVSLPVMKKKRGGLSLLVCGGKNP